MALPVAEFLALEHGTEYSGARAGNDEDSVVRTYLTHSPKRSPHFCGTAWLVERQGLSIHGNTLPLLGRGFEAGLRTPLHI